MRGLVGQYVMYMWLRKVVCFAKAYHNAIIDIWEYGVSFGRLLWDDSRPLIKLSDLLMSLAPTLIRTSPFVRGGLPSFHLYPSNIPCPPPFTLNLPTRCKTQDSVLPVVQDHSQTCKIT